MNYNIQNDIHMILGSVEVLNLLFFTFFQLLVICVLHIAHVFEACHSYL